MLPRRARLAAISSLALATSVFMTEAHAADVAATSKVDAVTVFPLGAEVTRVTKVRIPAGDHTVVLTDLPAGAVSNSIRVEGKSVGTLQIGSVDTRQTFVTREEAQLSAVERKKLEADIEKLGDDKAGLQAIIAAAEQQKRFIANLTDLPGKPVPAGMQPQAQPDWAALAQLIGDRTAAVQKQIIETQMKVREVDRQIEDLRKKLAPIAPTPEARTEVKITVTAAAALEADLTVRYQVGNAGWTPFYDARLATGTRTEAPKLQLIRRAAIQQRSGEPWDNIALSLSTTRPSQGSAAPDLAPMLVDVFDPSIARPMPAPVATSAPMPQASRARAQTEAAADAEGDAAKRFGFAGGPSPAPKAKDAEEIRASIDGNAFQAIYGIAGRTTVLPTGEVKRVQIDATDLEPNLTLKTVPKRDPRAFLYAKMVMPQTTAVLAGQVSLFRDNTFVGQGRLPQLSPGEDHELGFGQDDNVRVKYAVTEEKRSESGIISTSKNDAKAFKISVRNLHQRPMPVRVIDQQPVSVNQEVKVEFTTKTPPTGRDPDDKRGLIFWDFTLPAGEERVIDFGYRITWPSAKQLSVR